MVRKGKGYNNWTKGWKGKNKGRDKGAGRKGDNDQKGTGKDKGKNNTIVCYICGKTGHYS
eukprot:443983-Amphidinium_carterae.1